MASIQFSGLASGIDSGALIDAVIEARQQANVLRRAEIDHLQSENDSLEELNTKILTLSDLVDQFRTLKGGGVRKRANSSNSDVATAVAGSSALNGTLSLNVIQTANSASLSFNHSYGSLTDYVSTTESGVLAIFVGTGDSQVEVSVNITQDSTTVAQLVDAINAHENASGRLSASIVNVGTTNSPDYRIMLNGLQQGTELGFLEVDTVVDVPPGELLLFTEDQARNAQFTVAGISGTIERATNTVDNLIPGLTLQLKDVGAATITVADDPDSTADLVEEIVKAFNDIVKFVAENDTVKRLENSATNRNVFGSLAKTKIDNDFISRFRAEMLGTTGDGSIIVSLSQLGISTNRDGTLNFDAEAFKSAIAEDSQGVQSVLRGFADSSAGVSGFMYQYTKFNGIIDLAQEANNSKIKNINDSVEQHERVLAKLRENLEGQFSRLEALSGRLQSQQAALTGILAGLSNNR